MILLLLNYKKFYIFKNSPHKFQNINYRILSQRQTDEIAREFVRLKSECRYETESTIAASMSSQQLATSRVS